MSEPPARPVRPRDAASLIILRGQGEGTEVLLGKRAPRHSFVPNYYVFPGGRVDAADRKVPAVNDLRPDVAAKVERRWGPRMGRAIATAALRETYEECGLVFGELDDGGLLRPNLAAIDYVARAITPAHSPIRFHARFFLAHDEDASGHVVGNGELLDLRWVPLPEALELPLVDITEFLIGRLWAQARGEAVPAGAPLFSFRSGRATVRYEPE